MELVDEETRLNDNIDEIDRKNQNEVDDLDDNDY